MSTDNIKALPPPKSQALDGDVILKDGTTVAPDGTKNTWRVDDYESIERAIYDKLFGNNIRVHVYGRPKQGKTYGYNHNKGKRR